MLGFLRPPQAPPPAAPLPNMLLELMQNRNTSTKVQETSPRQPLLLTAGTTIETDLACLLVTVNRPDDRFGL